MRTLRATLAGLARLEEWVLTAAFSVMGVVLLAQVFFRYVLNAPLIWSEELARYLLVWVTFLGIPYGIRHRAHIEMEYFFKKFPHPLQRILPIVTQSFLVVCLVVLEVVLVLSFLFAPRTGRPVDFSRNYMPLPDWYFLFLYQLLKYFPGRSAFFGVVVIPCAALFMMFALPFMEKTGSRRLRDRLPSAAVAALLLVSSIVLTVLSLL